MDTPFLPARRATAALLALVATATLGACVGPFTAAAGPVVKEQRSAGAYTRIEAGFGMDVDIRFGTTPSIEVEAAQNLVPLVVTRIDGGTLQITATRDFLSQDRPQVHLVVIDLEAISLDGGARAGIDSLSRDALGVELSGGSVLTATGSVGMLAMDAGGGAVASLERLDVGTAHVDLGGGARAGIKARDRIVGDVGGGALLTVAGNASLEVDTSGGGTVTHG